jgi:hypothetical protein
MIECRHCREFIRGDVERIGARCPRCRLPLYERPETHQRPAQTAEAALVMCARHARSASIGVCRRCATPLCSICRTRWYDQVLCVGCIERALEVHESTPEEEAVHRRQAQLSLWCAVGGWALLVFGSLPMLALRTGGSNEQLKIVSNLVVLSSFVPALFGIGQGAAAIRVRGDRLRLATWGLTLAGSLLGLMIGFLLFNTYFN